MTRKLTASKVNSKIEELEPRLTAIAKKVSSFGLVDWEDLYQSMLVGLIERSSSDPSFFEQTDAYILKYGEFMARHTSQKASVYLKYVDEEGFEVSPEEEHDDANSTLDLMIQRERILQGAVNVEKAVEISELGEVILEGCDFLTSENLKVVTMLYYGYKQTEIAKELGISKPAVNQRIKTIASTLQGFVQGY